MDGLWYEVICELCGMVVEFTLCGSTSGYPSPCQGNAGGRHYRSRAAEPARFATPQQAKECWARSKLLGDAAMTRCYLERLEMEREEWA